MAIGLTEVVNQVMGRIAASYGAANYGVLVETERFPSGEISDACIDADGQVCMTFLQKRGNGQRTPFLSTVSVAHGAAIPAHVGEIESVQIGGEFAEPTRAARIKAERVNSLGIPYVPKYAVDGNTLYHNGVGTASVTIATFARKATLQSPDEYAAAVVALASSMLLGKNGNKMDAAAGYLKFFETCLGPIGRGESGIPALPSPQSGQAQQAGIPMGAMEG